MGLSARLLLLTVFFVMLAELLIYTPSIARYRKVYLEDHLIRAHLATVALDAVPELDISTGLGDEVLAQAGVHAIVLRAEGRHILVVREDMPPAVDAMFDLRQGNFVMWIVDAFAALGQDENRVIRVLGSSPRGPDTTIEVVLDEAPMRAAMYGYSNRILQLSIVISLITAGLVYLSLHLLLVRPMRRITETMTSFREDPEDMSRTSVASTRRDEIGVAQRELSVMQKQLRAALHQKTRLATLGAAVAKINHDLRNSLSTAVLISDRLADIDDPEVKKLAPRLYQSIDRAVELCSQTLNFVADATPPPQSDPIRASRTGGRGGRVDSRRSRRRRGRVATVAERGSRGARSRRRPPAALSGVHQPRRKRIPGRRHERAGERAGRTMDGSSSNWPTTAPASR